ncbi:MAG TPA: hypothetical protein VHE35_23600 [Kofleriaceae bacterium]|nr:hypothetical protein [Kofleriaceae bacterium]
MFTSRRAFAFAAFAALASLAACGDNGGTTPPTPDAGPQQQGAIVLAERVFQPMGRSYYVSVVSEMPTAPLDRTKALELTSADIEVFNGNVYIRDRNTNIISRYTVGDDLSLTKDGEVSFANTGLPSSRAYTAYLSPSLAFILDSADLKMIGWDPTAMRLTGDTIPLDFLAKPMLPTTSLGQPTRVGDKVIIPVSWEDDDNLLIEPGIGAALILDSNMTAPPTLIEDPRVGGGYVVWGFGNDAYVGGTVGGDLKLFGHTPSGAAVPHSGAVRLKAGATAFDPGFAVDLDAATGTIGAWGIHMLDPTHVLAQILDPATDRASITTPDDFYDSTSFFYVMLDTTTNQWTRQTAIPAGGIGNAQEHVIDGTLYVQVTGDSGAEVHPVTAAAGIGPKAFDVPSGDLWFARRLR